MRSVLLASVVLVVVGALSRIETPRPAEAQAADLLAGVVDANFEAGGAGWVPSPAAGLFLDPAGPVHGGASAGRVEASAAGVVSINTQYWLVPTGAHAEHTLRLWLFDDDPRTSTLQVALEFLGSDLRVRNFRRETLGDTTSGWQLVTVVASGVEGTAYVRIDVRASASAAGARIYVDDVTLEREPLPTATPTSTPAASPTPTATATPTSSATPTSTAAVSPTATPVATASPPAAPKVFDTLTNGGFEDGLYGWADVGADVEVSGGAARVISRSTSTKYLYQTVRVTPGGWYEASAYLVPGAGVDAAWVRVAWYASEDGSGSQLATVDSEAFGAGAPGEVRTGPVQAPHEAHTAQVRIMLRPLSAAEAQLTVDDVRFEVTSPPPAPAPAPTPAPNPTAAPQSAGASSAAPPTSAAAPPSPSEGAAAPRLVAGRPVEDSGGAPSSGGPRAGSGSSGSTRASSGAASGSGPSDPASTSVPRLDGFAPEILLRITELMPDPTEPGNDADFEWVEVTNVGSEPVALVGITLRDNAGVVALPDMVLAAGASLVLAAPRAAVPDAVTWRATGALSNGLGNSGDRLALLAADGRIIDALSYGSDTTYDNPPLLPPGPGRSLKRYFGDDGTFAGAEVSDTPSPGRYEPPPVRPAASEETTGGASIGASEAGDGGAGAVWYVLGGLGALGLAGAAGQRVRALRHRERSGDEARGTIEV